MSSTLRSSPEQQEQTPHLTLVPDHNAELTEQIESNRKVIGVIPVDWTEDDPNFTAEELWAEQTVRVPVRNEYNFHPSDWTHDDPALQTEEEKGIWGRGID